MGTRMAPTFANLFMADFEDRHVYTHYLQPTLWVRFIDDIFLLWDHKRDNLNQFISHLNESHHSIKFTHEISTDRVAFLDTEVIKH